MPLSQPPTAFKLKGERNGPTRLQFSVIPTISLFLTIPSALSVSVSQVSVAGFPALEHKGSDYEPDIFPHMRDINDRDIVEVFNCVWVHVPIVQNSKGIFV